MEKQTINETAGDGTLQNFFTGSVPRNYETYMGLVMFTPYAMDIVERIKIHGTVKVLELAAGTGRVTRHLVESLPDAEIIATDISEDMMAVAKETIHTNNLSWQNVNMMEIPFADESFDLIICQFGLMFVPDKKKALEEMYRVLKTGGQLLFNTWGNIEENPMWQISFQLFAKTFGEQPMPKELGPFGLPNAEAVKELLLQANFFDFTATEVRKTSEIESASLAAKSFLMTSPVLAQKPEMFPEMHKILEAELSEKLGDNPLHCPLLALVFEATK